MKMSLNLAAALLMGLSSGELTYPKSITQGNRLHRDRARDGSPEHMERLAAAEARRTRKAAKRAVKPRLEEIHSQSDAKGNT